MAVFIPYLGERQICGPVGEFTFLRATEQGSLTVDELHIVLRPTVDLQRHLTLTEQEIC